MARVREATLAAARDGVANPDGWRAKIDAEPALRDLIERLGAAIAEAKPKA